MIALSVCAIVLISSRSANEFVAGTLDFRTVGISQFTTTPWPFERDLIEYLRAGAGWIEICEFKLDRADYAPQLDAVGRAGLRVSSVQSTVHAVYPDSLAPVPLGPQLRVRHFERSMERIVPQVPTGTPFVVISAAAPDGDNARCTRRCSKSCRGSPIVLRNLGYG